jgi:hypothetical protein
MVKITDIHIEELAKDLAERSNKNQQPALILGSRAGGLFRSNEFYEDMRVYSMRNFAELSLREQFSEAFNILGKAGMWHTELRHLITQALQSQHFTIADDCLARLMKEKHFKVIFSNNMDDLLESAFSALGMREHHEYLVFVPERHSIEDILYSGNLFTSKVIKICGELQTAAHNIEKHLFHADSGGHLQNLLYEMHIKEVLIVGLDPVWDAGIFSALPARATTIWLVNEDEVVKEAIVNRYQQAEQIRYIIGSEGEYEQFFRLLYWYINPGTLFSHEKIADMHHQLSEINHGMHKELNEMRQNIASIQEEMKEMRRELGLLRETIQELTDHLGNKRQPLA